MKYETILFDVDDTLFDFGMTEKMALQKTLHSHGISLTLTDLLPAYKEISSGLWRDLEQGHTTLPELGVERFKRLFRELWFDHDAADRQRKCAHRRRFANL